MKVKPHRLLMFALLIGVMFASGKVASEATDTTVPASLEALFSPESGYLAKCNLAHDLGTSLQDDEVSALLRFISSSPKELSMTRGHFNSVGDKVINALQRQNTIPPALVDSLITMFNDKTGDFTWRDYCVQHLGQLYSSGASEGKREQVRTVWEAALKPESRMAGTVVLALRRNMGQEGISKAYVSQQAAKVAMDDQQPDASRLTAIQVAASLGNRDMLPLAHDIVQSRHTVPFRMSAMASIGMLGDASDLELLSRYTSSSDMRLRTASRAAVEKIEARLNPE